MKMGLDSLIHILIAGVGQLSIFLARSRAVRVLKSWISEITQSPVSLVLYQWSEGMLCTYCSCMAPGKLSGGVPDPSLPAGIQNLSPIKCLIGIIGLLTEAHGKEVLERVAKIQYRRAPSFNLCCIQVYIPIVPVPFPAVNGHHVLATTR